MKEKIKNENKSLSKKPESEKTEKGIQAKDIIIIIVSLSILISTQAFNMPHYSPGYLLGKIIGMLPTWVTEGVIVTSIIWVFRKKKMRWLSCLPWGFLIIAGFHLVLCLFEIYALSQISSAF